MYSILFCEICFIWSEVGPIIQTTEVTYFDEMLGKITVDGGDDCPEMSLTGIKQGLEKGLPESFLFVFTDAKPKDSELLPEILTAIDAKHTQVSNFWIQFHLFSSEKIV